MYEEKIGQYQQETRDNHKIEIANKDLKDSAKDRKQSNEET